MLTFFVKLLQILNSENSARQMAFAISLGCLWGLSPLASVQGILALTLVLILKANISCFILSGGIFTGVLALAASPISQLGEFILTHTALQDMFTLLYQFSFFKLAHFHHTTTLGGLIIAKLLFIPLYLLSFWIIASYRVHIKSTIDKFKIVKALKASRFYRLYLSMTA